MARTLAELDAAVANLEAWRATTVDPGLAQARTAIVRLRGDVDALRTTVIALDGFRDRVRAAWRALRLGRVEGVEDNAGGVQLQPAFSAEELRILRWLIEERSRVARR